MSINGVLRIIIISLNGDIVSNTLCEKGRNFIIIPIMINVQNH